MPRRRIVRSLRAGLACALIAAALGCGSDESDSTAARESDGSRPAASVPVPSSTNENANASTSASTGFTGSATCVACHAEQAASWERSQHRVAMAFATPESVKAPFAGESIREGGGTVSFGRQGRAFVVARDRAARGRIGPEATRDEEALRVSATFGVEPLQQYLLDAVEGRVQVLPWAWDTRPKAEGGQRWLNLYPEATLDPTDPLHFSRPAQNWNHVCADCHVTAYRKRFAAERNQFESRWEELGVGCESCHGPGQEHVRWAAAREGEAPTPTDAGAPDSSPPSRASMGLAAQLDERVGVTWSIDPATGNGVRSVPRTTSRELDVCAPCHARRSAITEAYVAGEPFLDHYRPVLLDAGLYYADGQQRDEVFSWGSFLQSRMHAKGVTCSDCHEPHSGELRAEGNALCAQCHAPTKYATPKHHHHAVDSPGSACVACHMPTTTYMQVDPRHDHSLRVPRPDQARALGLPDACSRCHGENRAAWADRVVRGWLGRPAQGLAGGGAEAIQASETGALDAAPRLRRLATDASQPPIVRATALARLDASQSARSAELLAVAARDADPLVRLGALEGLASAPEPVRVRAAAGLLEDPRRAVRFEAVRVLAPVTRSLSAPAKAAFERAAAEYVAALQRDADRAEARTQLGLFLAERGDVEGARRELTAAIALEPAFEAAHADLADLERAVGRDDEAIRILDAGLARLPESAALHHARGLARVRLGRTEAALEDLARAVALDPGSARFAYVQAVALHSSGQVERAIGLLERVAEAQPGDVAVREALVSFLEGAGRVAAAVPHREALGAMAAAESGG
jgi:tetratricopeptide (TPR) repeat protein